MRMFPFKKHNHFFIKTSTRVRFWPSVKVPYLVLSELSLYMALSRLFLASFFVKDQIYFEENQDWFQVKSKILDSVYSAVVYEPHCFVFSYQVDLFMMMKYMKPLFSIFYWISAIKLTAKHGGGICPSSQKVPAAGVTEVDNALKCAVAKPYHGNFTVECVPDTALTSNLTLTWSV